MIGWIIGGVVFVVVLTFVITTYNTLVRLRNKVKNSFAQIDTQLQRRFDLIPNLVETVKGFCRSAVRRRWLFYESTDAD